MRRRYKAPKNELFEKVEMRKFLPDARTLILVEEEIDTRLCRKERCEQFSKRCGCIRFWDFDPCNDLKNCNKIDPVNSTIANIFNQNSRQDSLERSL